MRRHFASHWRAWVLIVAVVVVVNEAIDRSFFDHHEHIDGDVVITVVALVIAFFGSYFAGRLKARRTA